MLILTRRVNEKLIIDENVTVTVLSIKGNQVRIGIEAPREVTIHREEIYRRILEEKKSLNGNGRGKLPAPTAPPTKAHAPTRTPTRTPTSTLSVSGKR